MNPPKPQQRASLLRAVLRGAVAACAVAAVASCGSRTGLFGPEPPDELVDASADVNVIADARLDVTGDVRRDGRVDASLDAKLDATDDGPTVCIPGTFGFTLATPQLMFVLDRSGSMDFSLTSTDLPIPPEPTRWQALRDALAQTLTPLSDQIAMGARFYPSIEADGVNPASCEQDTTGVAIAPALSNAGTILGVFDTTHPVGGTPTSAALDLAAREISSSRTVVRAMVIATDGAPNCNEILDPLTCTCTTQVVDGCRVHIDGTQCLDDTRAVQSVSEIFGTRKIPVFVVGIGVTSSFAATLDAMAVAGGRPRAGSPRYYPAESPAELTNAFTVVRDSVAKCSYITPSSPDKPDAISVDVLGTAVRRDVNHVDGWDWIDREYGHLQLFGPACDRASAVNVSGTIACDADH